MSELDRLQASCLFEIEHCDSLKKLDEIRTAIFGKNGKITELMKQLRTLDNEQKRQLGQEINLAKTTIMERFSAKFSEIEMRDLQKKLEAEYVDVSMPARPSTFGKIHPITKVAEELADILSSYGFMFEDGPDIEGEFFNFTALNIPDHHPARTMHDTFYLNMLADEHGRKLLRTHTSPVQHYTMITHKPPFRMFSIGRVYRSDSDATHTPMFDQIECLIVDKNIGFAHLKWILLNVLKKFFHVSELKLRFRPSFFPFTEPSVEVDIAYELRNGKMFFGTGDKWLEICGGGVVHPNVLNCGNINTSVYQGIAIGFGLERLASLKYGIPDLRGYFESDDRWREAFGFSHVAK